MGEVTEKIVIGVTVPLVVAAVIYTAKTSRARRAFVDLYEDTSVGLERKREECRQLYGLAFVDEVFSDKSTYESRVNALKALSTWWRLAFFWNAVRVLERQRRKSEKSIAEEIHRTKGR